MSIPFSFVVIAFVLQSSHLAPALALVVGRDDTNITANLGSANSGSGTPHIVEAAIIAFLVLAILFLITVHLFRHWSGFFKHIKWIFFCRSSPSTVPAAGPIPAPRLSRTVTNDSSSSTLTSSSAATAVDIDLRELPKAHCPK